MFVDLPILCLDTHTINTKITTLNRKPSGIRKISLNYVNEMCVFCFLRVVFIETAAVRNNSRFPLFPHNQSLALSIPEMRRKNLFVHLDNSHFLTHPDI